MTRRAGAGQSGQTLIMFALTMTFMFLSLIALVGDADTLMVHYNQVNSAALLGAQAGATAIDEDAFYQGRRALKAADAVQRCESTAQAAANAANQTVKCTFNPPNTVTAEVTRTVSLPIPMGPIGQPTVRATRTGQAVFGGLAVDPGP